MQDQEIAQSIVSEEEKKENLIIPDYASLIELADKMPVEENVDFSEFHPIYSTSVSTFFMKQTSLREGKSVDASDAYN